MMPDGYESARERLAELLYHIPLMKSADGRNAIFSQTKRWFPSLSPAPGANDKIHCLNILDAVLELPGALQRLAAVLNFLDEGSIQAETFARKVSELLPCEFLTLHEWIGLITEVGEHVSARELAYYYRIVTNEFSQQAFGDMESLARELVERRFPDLDNDPLILLCEAIAQRAPTTTGADVPRAWSVRLAEVLESRTADRSARSRLAQLRSAGARVAAEPGHSTLTLQLDPSGPRPDHYLFSAWLYLDGVFTDKFQGDDHPMALDQVREALVDVVDNVLQRLEKADQASPGMELEFILPRHLLCHPFDQWKNRDQDYMLLGVQFPVVVRDLYRLYDPVLRNAWRRKWHRVQLDNGKAITDLSYWVMCTDKPHGPGQVFYRLLPENFVSLGLTFQPGDGSHPFDLAEALDAGTPIAVWPRGCEHAGIPVPVSANGAFRAEIMNRLAGRHLTDLPKIALDMRIDDARSGMPGAGLTVLWDDPTRCPEPQDFNLDAPGPLEGNS